MAEEGDNTFMFAILTGAKNYYGRGIQCGEFPRNILCQFCVRRLSER